MRKFGCPACGSTESRVIERFPDEDGNPMRLRRCVCGQRWATEEVPITDGSYYPRILAARKERRLRLPSYKQCADCGQQYRVGFFRQHVRFSEIHEAALAPRRGSRNNQRRIAREWRRASFTNSPAKAPPSASAEGSSG